MPSGGQPRENPPDIIVWDHVIEAISENSQSQDTVGLLLGFPTGSDPQVAVIDDIVPSRPLSGQNGAFSQTILAELLEDWRNNHREKQVVGWFRTISTAPRPLRLHEDDPKTHQSYFTEPYQVALAFSRPSSDTHVGFFKSDRGNLDLERIYPFIELSDSPFPGDLSIPNMNVSETAQQGSGSGGGGGRQPSQSFQLPLPPIVRLGLPILILLAVLTPLLLHFGVIDSGGTPAGSADIIELTIPAANDDRMSRLDGPAEGITSITFMNLPPDENQEDGTLFIEKMLVNPLGSDPPGGFINYAYYSIASKNTNDQTTIKFEFEIPESWMVLNDVGMQTIRAYKSSGNGWDELADKSEVILEQGKYSFEASSNGFSYFALGGTKADQSVSNTTVTALIEAQFFLTPVPSTATPVPTSVPSTPTPAPTAMAAPTPTAVPSTPTPTPTAMAAPTPTPTATAVPALTPTPTQVRVTYKVAPPESGDLVAAYQIQDSTEQVQCDKGEVSSESDFVFLCPADTEIKLSASPNGGFRFVSMDIQAGDGDKHVTTNDFFPYLLEFTDITITVDFKEND